LEHFARVWLLPKAANCVPGPGATIAVGPERNNFYRAQNHGPLYSSLLYLPEVPIPVIILFALLHH
jgi:hypothetical protein